MAYVGRSAATDGARYPRGSGHVANILICFGSSAVKAKLLPKVWFDTPASTVVWIDMLQHSSHHRPGINAVKRC
ncbi:uncharacterized protein BO96DRAFT_47635 [Aspergillus niger CBS 101883]|uniref:Uncharacterized protein n=1 Tax=Aspergillus niger ATCC 13496 TaxID=1353008 RepID=A0A370BQ85_ASPNG|nr:uncharacterized protein BO96DRAFT_47635 [Aspergillus niger CBS 101883]PYH56612.1 hypothetical protein BO96DRAFT_47635 [Aspergillus niger CBS 101883]RDH15669.1 hypothetical protein M747DRAFT_129416 [Aspergillus niger ATCC 13496]